jgi:hypothetical protein
MNENERRILASPRGIAVALVGILAAASAAIALPVVRVDAAAELAVPETDAGFADLELEIEVGRWDPKARPLRLDYTLIVRNLGPSGSTGAELTSPVGDYLEWSGGDPACRATEGEITCAVGPLEAGASIEIAIAFAVRDPYPAFAVQEAWLSPHELDPSPKNDRAVVETRLDLFVPTLEEVVVATAKSTESLGACSQLAAAPNRLELRFSEPLRSGGLQGDVDSTESYRLYAPGPDGDFEISACGEDESQDRPIDDVEIPLFAAHWNAESATVELDVAGSPLRAVDGVRRLIACESLRDFGENAIDGDGDGNPGDAAVRAFRIDTGNLVRNGHFDCNLDGWSALAPTPEDWTLGADASGSAVSASSRIDNSAAWPTVGIGICVPTLGGSRFDLRLRHRLSPIEVGSGDALGTESIVGAEVTVACTPYSSVSCTGEAMSADGPGAGIQIAIPTTADWTPVVRTVELPDDGVGSLLCTVSASAESTPFVLEVDEVGLHAMDSSVRRSPDVGVEGRSVSID